MPFAMGSQGSHSDASHQGSAKRDTASGVAGLDAAGDVLVLGPSIELTRDVNNDTFLIERTSGEVIAAFRRTAANTFSIYNNTVAGAKILQDSSMKNAANGIAGLDASAKMAGANLPTNTAGGVVGLDGNNRMNYAYLPARLISEYFHAIYDEMAVTFGTWGQVNEANQTDYDDFWVTQAGYIGNNATHDINDEIQLSSSLRLFAGSYKVVIASEIGASMGIVQLILGVTTIAEFDLYNASLTYNQVSSTTYSPTSRISGALKLKVTGKNASSDDYFARISRIEIIRTG